MRPDFSPKMFLSFMVWENPSVPGFLHKKLLSMSGFLIYRCLYYKEQINGGKMNHLYKIISILLGISLSTAIFAKPGDKAREMKERAEQAREKARRDSFKREREIKIAEKERIEKQIAVNKYVGAVQANGGVAPKWAEKSEGARVYKQINQNFQASINQANAQVATLGAATGMNAEQIKKLQADMKKDIQAGGKITPAATTALTKAAEYKPAPPAPKPNRYDQYSNDNFNDSWKGPLPSQAKIDALKTKYNPPKTATSPATTVSSGNNGDYCAVSANKSKEVCKYGAGITGNNYSAQGVPLTRLAWDQQAAIDGGKLRQDYAETSRWNAMGLAYCKQNPTIKGCDGYKETVIKHAPGGGVYKTTQFMNMNSASFADKNQQSTVNNYIWQANYQKDNSAFILDFLPTNTDGMPFGWKPGDNVTRSREISAGVADELRNQDKRVYGLVVPYNNNALNILLTNAEGPDVNKALSANLAKIDKKVTTVAVAYSQPSAGLQNYVLDKGNTEGLDYAIAVAPMGGERISKNTPGQSGVFSGNTNGVNALIVANSKDPATDIFYKEDKVIVQSPRGPAVVDKGVAPYLEALLNFIDKKNPNGPLHGDPCADGSTCGYPKDKLQEEVVKLFNNPVSPYGQTGKWSYDNRPAELQGSCPPGQRPKSHGRAGMICEVDVKLNQDPANYRPKIPTVKIATQGQIPKFEEYVPGNGQP